MSRTGTGPELPKIPVSLDDMVRWRRQVRSRNGQITLIQEHQMIVNAIDQGASLEQIAEALNFPVRIVRASLKRLHGISGEVAALLKDKHISQNALRQLRRVSEIRQREIAEMMVYAANYSNAYVEALILATPKDQLAKPGVARMPEGIPTETIATMMEEMRVLERELKAIKGSYGENMLVLTVARAYVRKLDEELQK